MYNKICILICDDSQHPDNINKNQEIAKLFTRQGLDTIYFGAKQQQECLASLDTDKARNITGKTDPEQFYHKGASITRNISYLKLQQLQAQNEPCLFYFIDSDQEFQINITSPGGDSEYYAINYFYQLDKLFSQNKISMLTGKVVGDPPVSPAVMAGTFLDDVIHFIQQISEVKPEQKCSFHCNSISSSDATYHDMADLFGFKIPSDVYDYHCTLTPPHNHIQCFNDFSCKLNQFFDGEHPTRKTYYQHEDLQKSITPARTIYTGNYIFKPENLHYFIPFANLKLRMAGPVLGRIIKSELGEKFVSANLPMLHNRTIESLGQSEFRPGVNHQKKHIDLSGEFIRQFFGDVMLFSIIELTERGYPDKNPPSDIISKIVQTTFQTLKTKYNEKQKNTWGKVLTLKNRLNNSDHWWYHSAESSEAITNFMKFIENIEINFSENAPIYTLINTNTDSDLKNIVNAINAYSDDRSYWQSIISENQYS